MNTKRWNCDSLIDLMFIELKDKIKDHIEMLYIQEKSKLLPNVKKDIDKKLTTKLIEDYLKKRGYVSNYVSGKSIMIKDFTCVYVQDSYIEVWHDMPTPNNKSVFINKSLLTGLPITLNYMERI